MPDRHETSARPAGPLALSQRAIRGIELTAARVYEAATAPSILVPKVGHTIKGANGIVSRSMSGFSSARQVVARDIMELRRVYPEIPNKTLQNLIRMNKGLCGL